MLTAITGCFVTLKARSILAQRIEDREARDAKDVLLDTQTILIVSTEAVETLNFFQIDVPAIIVVPALFGGHPLRGGCALLHGIGGFERAEETREQLQPSTPSTPSAASATTD